MSTVSQMGDETSRGGIVQENVRFPSFHKYTVFGIKSNPFLPLDAAMLARSCES